MQISLVRTFTARALNASGPARFGSTIPASNEPLGGLVTKLPLKTS